MPDDADWDRAELLEIYRVSVEEYRFQVRLNWSRTQYLFVLTAGILAVGTGLLDGADSRPWLIGAIFVLGVFTTLHAIAVTARQHTYYRAARDRMLTIATELCVPDAYRLTTTPGMKGEGTRHGLRRLGTVTWMQYGLFGMLAALHTAAAWHVLG